MVVVLPAVADIPALDTIETDDSMLRSCWVHRST